MAPGGPLPNTLPITPPPLSITATRRSIRALVHIVQFVNFLSLVIPIQADAIPQLRPLQEYGKRRPIIQSHDSRKRRLSHGGATRFLDMRQLHLT